MQPRKVLPLCERRGQGSGGGSMEPFVWEPPPSTPVASTVLAGFGPKAYHRGSCSASAGPDVIAEGGGGGRGWTLVAFKAD